MQAVVVAVRAQMLEQEERVAVARVELAQVLQQELQILEAAAAVLEVDLALAEQAAPVS